MQADKQEIEFNFTAPYYTLGRLTETTQNIWIVFHGYGQMTEHFIRRFDVLDLETNFLIAPQGLSRFYLDFTFKKVGASWMTREDRETDIHNQLHYLDAVLEYELQKCTHSTPSINLFGFSQGVATACRWAAFSQLPFRKMIIWAGIFPEDLSANHFTYLPEKPEVTIVMGRQDPYYRKWPFEEHLLRVEQAVGKPEVAFFDGKHEVQRELLGQLAK
ncbi:alpha/beta hydrolase [Rapidithrix thailandica]|uniref:Alpha/beta hydrolase n=1 Tax=Rapidithrix thailandica TaxID=413964 RepID=A0AAW9S092_9BACT